MANMISNISLCNVPIMPTHQIDFENVTKQQEYFNSKVVHSVSNCKYTPRTGTIRVKGYVDTFNHCNYGFYTNEYNGTSKTFYFWIVQKRAVARATTELTIQLDVFQTWLFDVVMERCFIERMHTATDAIGEFTYPENFELGDYVVLDNDVVLEMTGNMGFFVAVTDSDNGNIGGVFGRTYSGFKLRYYSYSDTSSLTEYIRELCNEGRGDSIAFIFQFPEQFFAKVASVSSGAFISNKVNEMAITKDINMVKSFQFNGGVYNPKNNKLFCYPFNCLTVTSPTGGNIILKYENFYSDEMKVRIESVLTQNSTFSLVPLQYEGEAMSYRNSIETNCYGLCSWNNDNYANWYAQHSASIQTQSTTNNPPQKLSFDNLKFDD